MADYSSLNTPPFFPAHTHHWNLQTLVSDGDGLGQHGQVIGEDPNTHTHTHRHTHMHTHTETNINSKQVPYFIPSLHFLNWIPSITRIRLRTCANKHAPLTNVSPPTSSAVRGRTCGWGKWLDKYSAHFNCLCVNSSNTPDHKDWNSVTHMHTHTYTHVHAYTHTHTCSHAHLAEPGY